MRQVLAILFLTVLALPALASAGSHDPSTSSYSSQETREIKSLSEEDIANLRAGRGWGLAKAAELNGLPGPTHLLELKEEIGLSASQLAEISALQVRMRGEAIAEGARLIALEEELEGFFRDRSMNRESLKLLLDRIEQSRAALRYVHLSAHLETPMILTRDQIAKYNQLRGYGSSPCDSVPTGHDAQMWRKHNGCE